MNLQDGQRVKVLKFLAVSETSPDNQLRQLEVGFCNKITCHAVHDLPLLMLSCLSKASEYGYGYSLYSQNGAPLKDARFFRFAHRNDAYGQSAELGLAVVLAVIQLPEAQ